MVEGCNVLLMPLNQRSGVICWGLHFLMTLIHTVTFSSTLPSLIGMPSMGPRVGLRLRNILAACRRSTPFIWHSEIFARQIWPAVLNHWHWIQQSQIIGPVTKSIIELLTGFYISTAISIIKPVNMPIKTIRSCYLFMEGKVIHSPLSTCHLTLDLSNWSSQPMVSISKMSPILDLSHPFKSPVNSPAALVCKWHLCPLAMCITSGRKILFYSSKRTQENLKLFVSFIPVLFSRPAFSSL